MNTETEQAEYLRVFSGRGLLFQIHGSSLTALSVNLSTKSERYNLWSARDAVVRPMFRTAEELSWPRDLVFFCGRDLESGRNAAG